jgi:hypothetical protein
MRGMVLMERIIWENEEAIRSIVKSAFNGEYMGYTNDAIPFIRIRVKDGVIEVPITHQAFKPILDKSYKVLDGYEKARLLAYEAGSAFKIHPFYIQLLILDVIQLSQLLNIRTADALVRALLEHPLSQERAGMIGRQGVEWLVRRMINVGLLAMPSP